MPYLTAEDFTTNIIAGHNINSYLAEADKELEDLCLQKGVNIQEINILHNRVKRYLIVYVLMRFCQDKMSTISTDFAQQDKYKEQYYIYRDEYNSLRTQITPELLLNKNVNFLNNTYNTTWFFRG